MKGYKPEELFDEQDTLTPVMKQNMTNLELAILNQIDRFNLVIDVINRDD